MEEVTPTKPSLTNRRSPTLSSLPSSPTHSPPVHDLNIDVLLLEEDENNADETLDNETNSQGASSAMSSLLPFQTGRLKRSLSDFSSIGSFYGNILDSNISIDDDLECGPVPDYSEEGFRIIAPTGNASSDDNGEKISSGKGRPDEVYINTAKISHKSRTSSSGKLSAYFGISRRHKSSEASIGGSSAGTNNSLSSIFESIGYIRNRQPHPSRGLTKRRERGECYRFLTGSSEPRPTSFENEREEQLFRERERRMVNFRASILMVFLVCILISIAEFVEKNDNKPIPPAQGSHVFMPRSEANPDSSISSLLAQDGVPIHDKKANSLSSNGYYSQRHTNNLSDITASNHKDTPLFWSIPESGSEIIQEVISSCHSYNLASAFKVDDTTKKKEKKEVTDSTLRIVKRGSHNLVNVDMSTPSGIERAKTLNLVPLEIANFIITPLFLDSLKLFDESHKGRAYTIIRHPIDRAVSLYHHLKDTNDPSVKDMTLGMYARVENNWMVRQLSGKIEGNLKPAHLDVAKDILEKKFVLGLFEKASDSLNRFENYFGVTYEKEESTTCRESALNYAKSKNELPGTHRQSFDNVELQKEFKLDLELYEYATQLYNRQGKQLFTSSRTSPKSEGK